MAALVGSPELAARRMRRMWLNTMAIDYIGFLDRREQTPSLHYHNTTTLNQKSNKHSHNNLTHKYNTHNTHNTSTQNITSLSPT
jgi:hypothetical protein